MHNTIKTDKSLRLGQRMDRYLRLTRLNRPIGIFLVGWPMLWALWLAAGGLPDPLVLAVFVVGCVLMRSAGCVINDFADRGIDGDVKRTKDRPLATGEVSEREALVLAALLALAAFALVLLLNPLTIALAFVGLALAAGYPFTKRYTHWPQAALGAAFGWAIPMAFAAQSGGIPAGGWVLFIGVLIWALVYDTMYAMVDRDDDLKIGVKSTAVLWGRYDRLLIGVFQALFFVCLIAAGDLLGRGLFYYLGVAVGIGVAIYHQWLIRNRDRQACFRAFMHHNWLGGVIFIGILLDTLVPLGH